MPTGSITIFGLQDRRAWEAVTVDALPGQSWGHAAGLAAGDYAPKLAVVDAGGARMLLPFQERAFAGVTDITSLPGLSGILIRPDSAAPLQVWAEFARNQGWVAGYLQLSPLNDGLVVAAPDQIVRTNTLYVFDLDDWDIERSIGYKMRRNVKNGTRFGAQLVTDLSRLAQRFPDLHADNLARLGGTPAFSNAAIQVWFDTAGVIAFGAELGGVIVNIQMGRRMGNWADLHLAGATDAGRTLQPWVIWQAAEMLRRSGVRYFNIGGYGIVGDGLHFMKSRFGAGDHPLRAVQQIYDPLTFARLCAETEARPDSSFFPPWRAPRT